MLNLKTGFFYWAHRGASAFAPENTMAAFRLAESLGADGIELDVHLSRDGVPIVIHDETVQRTTDGKGRISRMKVDALKQLDAGRWFDARFAGEPIPTLEEVLQWNDGRLPLNIEIKTAPAALSVLALLRQASPVPALVSSFNLDALEVLHQEAPSLPLGFLTEGYFWRRALARAQKAGAYSFHPNIERLSDAMFREVQETGLHLIPFTVNNPETEKQLLADGAKGIFTDGLFPRLPAEDGTLRQR